MITGSIAKLSIPKVKAGANIVMNISWTAYNPSGSFLSWWKVFIVAKDSNGNKKMVKDATVKADRITDTDDSLILWPMPNKQITVEIRLYGHDEVVTWDWNWW